MLRALLGARRPQLTGRLENVDQLRRKVPMYVVYGGVGRYVDGCLAVLPSERPHRILCICRCSHAATAPRDIYLQYYVRKTWRWTSQVCCLNTVICIHQGYE